MAEVIRMAHGAGGRLMADLIREVFAPPLDNEVLRQWADAAVFEPAPAAGVTDGAPRLALSTDSFVVQPLFFPGGDIGTLAVNGTVNDLAMMGARPVGLSAGFILEEGLEIEVLQRVVRSMGQAATRAGVMVVAGDTKVVQNGHGDGIYVTTAGVGVVGRNVRIGPGEVRPGDAVLVSGTVGDHGIAVLAEREGLGFEADLVSDCAPLNGLVEELLQAAPQVHCMRDPTRGGLAAALNEIAQAADVGVELEESAVPLHPAVSAACEMLGLDPFSVASEGRLVAFLPEAEADAALAALNEHDLGRGAARIGRVTDEHPRRVLGCTAIGGRRVVDMPVGELLPRIC
jgi:hydrogenase expression/formation protein HypE